MFTSQNLAMTNGVLCVYDAVPGEDAFAAGRQAASILKGKSPASLEVKDFGGKLLFDYKQLQFFRVDTNRAESKGIILNIPLMERYRVWFILFYSLIVGHWCCWLPGFSVPTAGSRVSAYMPRPAC